MKPESQENIIQIDEPQLKLHVNDLVRGSIEETLNSLLDEEANKLCGANRYERSESRKDKRAGHYTRSFETRSGKVNLKIPKLRKLSFETSIIERYKRRESSVEEALIEMYLAGVSVRRIEDVTEALWGSKVSPSTISNLNKKVYSQIEEWRNRPLEGEYPYVFMDGIYLKRSWGGEVQTVSVLIAIGVNKDGYREILGTMEGLREDKESWRNFLRYLKERGLDGVNLITSDKSIGLVESIPDFFPNIKWQRCVVHFMRNVFSKTPKASLKEIAAMLKAIYAQENRQEALEKSKIVEAKLRVMKLDKAANVLKEGIEETLAYTYFPREHWTRIRTNNPLERIMREIKRRTRVVGAFPDGNSALMLVTARLRYIAHTKWGLKKYLDTNRLKEEDL